MTEWLGKLKWVLLFALCILHFANLIVMAEEFDTSIDDDIRKKYNPSKIEEDAALPALPKILNATNKVDCDTNDNQVKVNSIHYIKPITNYSKTEQSFVRLKKGTKIKLKLLTSVSDATQKGTKLSFVSIYPVSTRYFTIPSGTIFKGYVVNSHRPQLSGNGGLIVININSILLNGEVQPIDASVTKANSKFIYLNNIKGKRKYISSMFRSSKPGYRFCRRMINVTGELIREGGSNILLSPFPLAAGVFTFGGNVFISPALALFHKGGNVILHEGSLVEVKLVQDIYIYL